MEPAPLGGYYVLFARKKATNIRPNRYMKYPICGDAYVLRLYKFSQNMENECDKFYKAIYDDVPVQLLDPNCNLLREIINQKEWRVLPPSPIVRLGLLRFQKFLREGFKRKEEQQMANEHNRTRQSERGQLEKDTKHVEQRQQIEGEKETLKEERQLSESERLAQRQRDEMETDRRQSRRLQEKDKEDEARKLERGREEKERQEREKAQVLPKRKRKLEKKATREPGQRQRRKVETQEQTEKCAHVAEVLNGLRNE